MFLANVMHILQEQAFQALTQVWQAMCKDKGTPIRQQVCLQAVALILTNIKRRWKAENPSPCS